MALYVELSTIINNIKTINNYTNKNIMVVLKNNAYGIGSKIIINLLKECNIKWIVYNTFEEYENDKDYIKDFKILILSSVQDKDIINNPNIYYSVNCYDDIEKFTNKDFNINVHLQVDTGMNRLGIRSTEECKYIINILRKHKRIKIDGIYTHFSSNCDEYNYYNKQLKLFNSYLKLYSFNTIHSASSSSLHKNIIGNNVRVGLAIYGYGNPYIGLCPSLYFTTKLINHFILHKGESIGYNQKYVAKEDIMVGVVPIGYNDIRDIKYLYYNNEKLKIIGQTCMNHTFVLLPHEINYLSSLLVLSKNDIIYKENNNWYHILTSLKAVKKNYIRRFNYDISTILKRTNKENKKYFFRRRSN